MVPGAVVVATVEVVPAGVVVTEEKSLVTMKLSSFEQDPLGVITRLTLSATAHSL